MERKKKIHDEFLKLGLRIDEPRDSGSGTSNDGNTARRCFAKAELFAKLVGVPVELVKSLHYIWIALSCGKILDAMKFGEFCHQVKMLWAEHVYWYKIPSTIHKVLDHGERVLRMLPGTISMGMLSEEPTEHMNSDLKDFSIHHARQTSRLN